MIFNSDEWKMIRNHFPLRTEEIKHLEMQVADTCMLVHGLIMWGLALQQGYASSFIEEDFDNFRPSMGW